MPQHRATFTTSLMGAAAAGAVVFAPIAFADDPPACAPDDQQCQQQQPDPVGIASSAADQANQVLDQAPPVSPYPTTGVPGGVCMRMNGFPIYIPPGGIPSEMASSGVPSGPVHAGVCTSEDNIVPADAVQRGTDAAAQIQGAATPPPNQEQQPPPPGP
jgi:hypothetical protein